MDRPVSAIWGLDFQNIEKRLRTCIESACAATSGPVPVFFRSDDVAVPGKALTRLLNLFASARAPLALAVVPAWLTRQRWRHLQKLGATAPDLWCWHQHGWRHKNHESKGKKQEFGPSRSAGAIREDLLKGRDRLEKLMGKNFYPVFTPPWNRCTLETLESLKPLGFRAVSRAGTSRPPSPAGFPDFPVTVDLHTRKSTHPSGDMENLLSELSGSISGGGCGIMIHHQRMNDAAFYFLQCLLETLGSTHGIRLTGLKALADTPQKACP